MKIIKITLLSVFLSVFMFNLFPQEEQIPFHVECLKDTKTFGIRIKGLDMSGKIDRNLIKTQIETKVKEINKKLKDVADNPDIEIFVDYTISKVNDTLFYGLIQLKIKQDVQILKNQIQGTAITWMDRVLFTIGTTDLLSSFQNDINVLLDNFIQDYRKNE